MKFLKQQNKIMHFYDNLIHYNYKLGKGSSFIEFLMNIFGDYSIDQITTIYSVYIVYNIKIIMTETQLEKGKIYLLMAYLGSGKTTFIRNVLNNKQGKKYAIIQNQFATGEMGIEQPLIMDESGTPFSNFLQLPNGCICCSAKNDLVASIEYILSNTDVRQIIVQTNGLADPAESIKQFWFDQQMKINGELHSVISIFSVQRFKDLQGKQLFEKQIVFANKALITFIDKSTEQETKELEDYIKGNNKDCQISRNTDYDVIQFLSGPNLFEVETMNDIVNNTEKQQHSHSHSGISSLFIKGKSQLQSKNQIQVAVGELLWQSGLKILRIKGVYSIPSSKTVYQLQGVDDLFEIKESNTNKQKYNYQSKVLIIGQNIESQKQKLQKILKITPQK